MSNTRSGLCGCGCGQRTYVPAEDDSRYGWKKGVPTKFKRGHYQRRKNLEAWFASMLDKSKGNDSCWEWTGPMRHVRGYASFERDGERILAHRFALSSALGRKVEGYVLHSCDNPPCCNPAHLREGTAKENAEDAVSRDRHTRGSRNGMSALHEADVSAIRSMRRRGEPVSKIAAKYGIGTANVYHICTRRSWKHVK